MPEAFAVLLVAVVALAAYIGARLNAANPAHHNANAEVARLRQQHAWLRERLEQAWRENWDQAMRSQIVDELDIVETQLAIVDTPARRAA